MMLKDRVILSLSRRCAIICAGRKLLALTSIQLTRCPFKVQTTSAKETMTFTTLFPLFFVGIFFITLLASLMSNRLIGWLLFGFDAVLCLVAFLFYMSDLQSPDYDYHAPNYGLLLMIAVILAFVLARPMIKLRAGKLILRLRQSTPMDNIGLIFAPVFICGAIFVLRPTTYWESDHSPVIDAQYFNSHGVLFLFMLIMGLNFLSTGLQRTEFRQRGLVHNSGLWRWNEFESHQWSEISGKPSELELILKLKPKKLFLKQIKSTVSQPDRQIIDELLAKDRQGIS
jgi:hypothetical protein